LLDQYELEGKSVAELMKLWKVSQATVYNLINKKDQIRLDASRRGFSKRKRVKVPKFEAIEKRLFESFKTVRKARPNFPIDGSWLKNQAQDIASELNITDFKGSDTWLEGFKSKYGLSSKRFCGESSKVNQMDINEWIESNKATILEYEPKDIFNS